MTSKELARELFRIRVEINTAQNIQKLNELKGREENILTLLRKAIWSEKIDEYNEKSIGRKGR